MGFINIVFTKKKKFKICLKIKKVLRGFLICFINFLYLYHFFSSFYKLYLTSNLALIFKNYNYNLVLCFMKRMFNKSISSRLILNELKENLIRSNGDFFPNIRRTVSFLNYSYKTKKILGFKLVCNGRFTRRQRSNKIIYNRGCVSLSNLSMKIDYSFVDVVLPNSLCGFKLYINLI